MMFLSSIIKAKVNLIAGMAIGVGMTTICKQMCKQKGQLKSRKNATQYETSEQATLKNMQFLFFEKESNVNHYAY